LDHFPDADVEPHFSSLNRKNRESHDAPSVVSDLHSTSGVSVTRGVSSGKMSQYLLSIIDKPKEHITESEKHILNELNTYVTYPEAVISSSIRKSFVDNDSDSHTSTKDIFSVDCYTKVAAKKKNMKEIFYLRDCLSFFNNGASGVTPVSSDSASTLTMTVATHPPSRQRQQSSEEADVLSPLTDNTATPRQKQFMKDQVELYRVAEALRFRLFLSGSFVSAPSVCM
jgi:hypothetical protein